MTMVIWLGAGSSPSLALDPINVSFPSPAPFFTPVAAAILQGFFSEQNLAVKLIVTRAEVDRAALISGDIALTLRIGSTILSAARGLPVRKDGTLEDAGLKYRNYSISACCSS